MKLPNMPMMEWVLAQDLGYWIDLTEQDKYINLGESTRGNEWIVEGATNCEIVLWKKILELKRK